MAYLRNCPEIMCNISCLFLREHCPKISYIDHYAPDFRQLRSNFALSKKNPANYLHIISGQFLTWINQNQNFAVLHKKSFISNWFPSGATNNDPSRSYGVSIPHFPFPDTTSHWGRTQKMPNRHAKTNLHAAAQRQHKSDMKHPGRMPSFGHSSAWNGFAMHLCMQILETLRRRLLTP